MIVMTTSLPVVEHTVRSVLIPLSALSPHPRLNSTSKAKGRFPDLISGLSSHLMIFLMRPPVVTPAGDGRYYVLANLRTVEWQRHFQGIRGDSEPHVGALVVEPVTDEDVAAWNLAGQSLMPLLLGELSTREERQALADIKAAGIPEMNVHRLPRRQRLHPLTRR